VLIRVILNGKKATLPTIRNAIDDIRKEYDGTIEVRVTYEYGDVHRFIKEAIEDKIFRVIIGGGDGTLNEAIDAMMQYPKESKIALGLLPLGTANDFAVGCEIPLDIIEALHLAIYAPTTPIDVVQVNSRYFINMATGGYGAEVTKDTPLWLKNMIGGGSYLITGILKLASMTPYKVEVKIPSKEFSITGVVGAICNGRQSGGGMILAPNAYINDGLLDVFVVTDIINADITVLLNELNQPSTDGIYIKRLKTPWIETKSSNPAPLNLDGEPYNRDSKLRYKVLAGAIEFALPSSCPCII
jgi:lipid kinase YegS